MNLSVSGHHVEVTPALRRYVQAKIGRITRPFDHVIDAHVILTANKMKQKAEVTLHVRGKDLHCESEEGDLYAELAAGARSGGAGISSQLQEARWLIKNVQQRFDTILRVSQAIVDRQRHFLEHGEVAMRPLVLREIAATLGLHESTISRVTTQKFMATPRGTFELKYFFGSHVATEAGGAASSTAIRALIKQLVAAEDARAPLSDARISQILGEQGIVVARRTIAKYRESLQIPPVNQRKAL